MQRFHLVCVISAESLNSLATGYQPIMFNWTEIVSACRRGDHRAQTLAYRQSWRMIFPSVHRIIRDKAEAEDVMQEAVIKGFERLEELKDPEKYIGWQKQICTRAALNKLRSRKAVHSLFPEYPSREEPDEKDLPELDAGAVKKHLENMPEGYRLVINLHILEGMSHEEIGTQLGITASTSRSQYSRAINKLKIEMLTAYEKQF